MKHPLFFVLAVTLAVACNAQKNSSASPVSPTVLASDNLVRLETGGCRGYCPVYKLTFHHDGSMDYEGARYVEKVGKERVKLTDAELQTLRTAVKRTNLWGYPSQIPTTIADAPAHTFTVFEGEKSHSVMGMGPLPKPIVELEKLMQGIAEAHGINVKKGVDPSDPASLKGEVIVKFKPDVNVGNFCMQFMEMKVRPVRRISEDNIWIIGFSPSELTEEQFIDIIKGMEGVIEVQPNKQVKERN